jgi:large subunit ribosomal protein L30
MSGVNKVVIRLKKSPHGCPSKIKATIKGLGLRKIGSQRELQNIPTVRGMIKSVIHMIDVLSEGDHVKGAKKC